MSSSGSNGEPGKESEDEKAILYGLRPVNLYGPQEKAPLNPCLLVPSPPGSVPLEI